MNYQDDDNDEDFDDPQTPELADVDEDSVDTERCPGCGKAVYEEAEICPHCRNYISREDSLPPRKPIWIIIVAVAALVAVIVVWVILGLSRN